jgi:hypothetical protein
VGSRDLGGGGRLGLALIVSLVASSSSSSSSSSASSPPKPPKSKGFLLLGAGGGLGRRARLGGGVEAELGVGALRGGGRSRLGQRLERQIEPEAAERIGRGRPAGVRRPDRAAPGPSRTPKRVGVAWRRLRGRGGGAAACTGGGEAGGGRRDEALAPLLLLAHERAEDLVLSAGAHRFAASSYSRVSSLIAPSSIRRASASTVGNRDFLPLGVDVDEAHFARGRGRRSGGVPDVTTTVQVTGGFRCRPTIQDASAARTSTARVNRRARPAATNSAPPAP